MTQKPQPIILTERDRALNQVRVALAASVAVLLLALAGFALIFGDKIGHLQSDLTAANIDRQQVKDDLEAEQAARAEANKRLIEAGEKPVTSPPLPLPGPQGEPGKDGRPPNATEIRKAVALFCADGACRGPAGRGVTREQVAGAVSTYCDARGQCRGPLGVAGRNGTDGQNGADGVTGPQGPPPTDAQVAAAVEAFCAGGRCQGVAGPPGPAGPVGPPGPACPPGFTAQERLVITDGGPQQATLCVAD